MNQRQFSEWARSQQAIPQRDVKTFTPAWAGFSASPNAEISYVDLGAHIMLFTNSTIAGTSNAATMSFGDLPDAIQPSNTTVVTCILRDNNDLAWGTAVITDTGTVVFEIFNATGSYPFDDSGFTSSGSKGLTAGWFVIYPK